MDLNLRYKSGYEIIITIRYVTISNNFEPYISTHQLKREKQIIEGKTYQKGNMLVLKKYY